MPKSRTQKEIELLDRTMHLYFGRPKTLTLAKMSEDTGISLSWLKSLPKTAHPSVNLVERLYNYLADTPLFS